MLVLTLILLPLEVVSFSLSGFSYPHYYLAALPVFALLLAYLAWTAPAIPTYHPRIDCYFDTLSSVLFLACIRLRSNCRQVHAWHDLFAEDNESTSSRRIMEV